MNGGKQLEPEFVQYRAMRQEIAALRRQRAALYVTDTVRAAPANIPILPIPSQSPARTSGLRGGSTRASSVCADDVKPWKTP